MDRGELSIDQRVITAAATRSMTNGAEPPLRDAELAAAERRGTEAGRLIDELVVRFTELDKPDFMLVLKTLGPGLVKRLLDAAGPASH